MRKLIEYFYSKKSKSQTPNPLAQKKHVVVLTDQEYKAMLRAAIRGVHAGIEGIEVEQLKWDDINLVFDVLKRQGVSTEGAQEVNEKGKLITAITFIP